MAQFTMVKPAKSNHLQVTNQAVRRYPTLLRRHQQGRGVLGYEPGATLENGLGELVAWLKGQTADDKVEQAREELSARGLTV